MSRRFSRRHNGPPARPDRAPARNERADPRQRTHVASSETEPDLGAAVVGDTSTEPTPDRVTPGGQPAPIAAAPPALSLSYPSATSAEGPAASPADAAVASPGERLRREEGTGAGAFPESGCTAAQLRRFIKSRPYVPMHELRRRFELNGGADDVSPIATSAGTVFLGLPHRESRFLADLVRQGDVGLEICRDPSAPMVVGVFAMKPISRQ